MRFVPVADYIQIEDIAEDETGDTFQWSKRSEDLVSVRVVELHGNKYAVGQTIIVISNMIQEFEFKKNKYRVCPMSAVVGSLVD